VTEEETTPQPPKGRRARKKAARELLGDRDLDALAAWARWEPQLESTLFSLLFEPDETMRWRAVEGVGRIAGVKGERKRKGVRETIRKLLWSMNDESGNLIWNAPEVIAEILVNVPALIDKVGGLLMAFLREAPFERGAHWAVARVAAVKPHVYRERASDLEPSLSDPDPYIRAHAALALIRILGGTSTPIQDRIASLRNDETVFVVYDTETGALTEVTIAQMLKDVESGT
jgi:HEAT repeat protein